MSSLKRNYGSGNLRSIPKYRDWLEYIYDSIPSRKMLARDCDCCELLPSDLIPESLVDTGEKTTVTGSGDAHYPGFFTETYGGFGEAYIPQVSWVWGAVANCSATLYPPLQVVPPSGFATTDGMNSYWCLFLSASIGDTTDTLWHEYETPGDPPPTSGDISASVTFGARLFAEISEVGRTLDSLGYWGPRPRYSVAHPDDAVDLRGYKSAKLDWRYWDKDNSGGSVTIEAFGYELEVAGAGAPIIVLPGSANMENIEPRHKVDGVWDEAKLSMEFFGSQALPEVTVSKYDDPPSKNGAIARTLNHAVYVKCDTSDEDYNTFRRASLALSNIQPEREVKVDIDTVTPHGVTVGPFNLTPIDGPDKTFVGGATHPVNTEYPVDDPDSATDEGVALTLEGAGTWTGKGKSYRAQVNGFVNAPFEAFEVMDEKLDTIGNPAFGFVYDSADMESGGVSGDAWRCPLRIPATAATWDAAKLDLRLNAPKPAQPEWAPGPDTTISNHYVSGLSTVSASATLPAAWMIQDYRWLMLRMAQSTSGQNVTLSIGGKSWTQPLPPSQADVTFDLCNPANATGYDAMSTVHEAKTPPTGWGWGVDGEVVLTVTSDAPFWLWSIDLDATEASGLLLVGETLPRWIDAFKIGDITLNPGKAYEETITTYAARGLIYLHDGRIVLDEELGLTASGFTMSAVGPEYRAWMVLNISDVVRAANIRQENSAAASVVLLEDLKPARFFVRSGWDGNFEWVDHADFFNGQAEAYHLRPNRTTPTNDVTVKADYCVDRVVPGVGASWIFTSYKWLGGGLHGLTVVDDVAKSAAIAADTSDATSRSDGLFVLPGDALLVSNSTYSLSTGWDGSPAQNVVEGTLMRACVRK